MGKQVCTRKDLQVFVGHLSHAASVVKQIRTFLHSLFVLLKVGHAPFHHIRLSSEAKSDILWWSVFLTSWNGSSFFPHQVPSVHVYSDTTGSSGCGALQVQKGWFALPWLHDWRALSIAEMELIPVVMAAALWGHCWAGQLVVFHSDNMGVMASVNKGISPEASLMQLLRSLSFIAAYFQFNYRTEHVAGVLNGPADALS